jgi:hypothetical protein
MNADDSVKIWLEEYKTLSSDIQSRVILQHGLMNYLLLIVSAASIILATLLKDNLFSKYQDAFHTYLLILPLLFYFFVWRHSNHDINIIDKASYINNVIRPNIIILGGDVSILGFEIFLKNARQNRLKQFGYLIWLSGEHFFHLLLAFIALIVAIFAFFSGSEPMRMASNVREFFMFGFENILLIADIALFGETIILKKKVATAYSTIVR